MVAITLRMCAGGRQQDIRRLYGVSRTSIYLTFHKVLEAIDHVESLFFPADDPEALADISSGFDRLTDGLLAGCVGAVDGYAISIIKPHSLLRLVTWNCIAVSEPLQSALIDCHYVLSFAVTGQRRPVGGEG